MNSKEIFEYSNKPHTAAELLSHPSYSHTRFNRWGSFTVYFRCSDSPSGVLSAGSFPNTPENCTILTEKKVRVNLGPSRGDIAAANPCGTITF